MNITELPSVGQLLQTGIFAGLTTTRNGVHCAVILLADKPAKKMTWGDAMKWAADLNSILPTRPVAALLYANLRGQLHPSWHWTCDELHNDTKDDSDSSYAWHCSFSSGSQRSDHKSAEGAAVAVRLIPLTT